MVKQDVASVFVYIHLQQHVLSPMSGNVTMKFAWSIYMYATLFTILFMEAII